MIFSTQYLRSGNIKHYIFILCFVFMYSFVQAQKGIVNQGAKIIVNSGAVIKITGTDGDYTNASSGSNHGRIDLDGKIEVEGDWTNTDTSSNVLINVNNDGEVVFNGSASQSIAGSNISYFEKLTLENTSGLNLSAGANVNSILTLTNGNIILNNSNLTIGTSGSITGTFGTSRMIVTNGTGMLVKSIGSTGLFTFPIGDSISTAGYSPIDFTLNSHSGLSSAWVGANVTNTKHPENTSPSEFLNRYWTLASSGITAPNYDADFHYLTSDITGTEANIYAAEYDGSTRTVYSTVDAANNILSTSGMSSFADYTGVDGTVPTVTIATTALDPTNTNPIPFTATFSETVSGFEYTDITIVNGSTSVVNTSDNIEFTFNVTPSGDGDITIDIASGVATDIAENDNTAADQYSILYDGTSPDVNLTSTVSDPTNSSPFTVKIQFTEKVSDFILTDITVTNGVASNLQVVETDSVWIVSIAPSSDGTVLVDINADVATDAAGNGNNTASQFSIDYDGTSPDVFLTTTESDPTNTSPFTLKIQFTEKVTGFALSDLIETNCTADNFTEVETDSVWTVSIIPSSDGDMLIDVNADVATDAAGNGNNAASQFSIEYDGTSPDVNITTTESDPTNSSSFTVKIQFTEIVSGFEIGDISVTNGSASNLVVVETDSVWTVDITPTADGDVLVNINADAATDVAGNGNNAATQFSITYDASDPIILTYNPTDGATGVALAANLEINFNEVVIAGSGNIYLYETGIGIVESFDVTTDISGSGTSTITVNPTSDLTSLTDYHIQIDGTAFDDDAGNSYSGISDATTWNFTAIDASFPEITDLSPADNAFDVLISSNLVITFDEAVTANSGNITIYDSNTDTIYEQIDVTSGQVSIVTNVVTINPSIDFVGETNYYVFLDNTALRDATLNNCAGISNKAEWNFTTEDVTSPTINSTTPLDDAIDVGISSDLEITFNENVVKGTGNIIITNATTATQHESIDVTTEQVTISSNVVTINPNTDFNGESAYYVEFASGVFADESGNDYGGISGTGIWNFTTEDVTPPTVVVSTAESSPTNTSPFEVTITFNEEVQNFTAGDISVTNATASGLNTSDSITFSVNITPDDELTVLVLVPAGVAQDLAGNGNEVSNELSVVYDITSPSVEITSVESGVINSNFDVTITFNENVTGFISDSITVGNGSVTNLVEQVASTVYIATISPTIDGSVTVDVLADKVIDVAGNGNTISNQFAITYDASAPLVDVLYPADDQVGIPVADDLQITFDENVYLGSGVIEIYKAIGDVLFEQIGVDTLNGEGTKTITINHGSDFESEVEYYVLVPSTAFTDLAGNNFAGISTNTAWTFTAADISEPTVSTIDPINGAIDVVVNSNLVVTFNENVTANIGNITIMNADTDLSHEIIDVTSDSVTIVDSVVTIKLINDFEGETNYYVLIDQSSFQDASGNNFGGVLTETEWNFSTEDVSGPVISSKTPIDGSGSVSLVSDLEITFSENVVKGTGYIIIMNATTASVHDSINVADGTVLITSNVVTINPSVDFAGETDYYVLIDAAAFYDDAGNPFAGIATETEWNFTTEDVALPIISSLSPLNNAVDVLYNSNLEITFSENVVKGSGNIIITNASTLTVHETIIVSSTQVTILGNTVTIDPSVNFAGETDYYVQIDADAFDDESGNSFAGISGTDIWRFTTEDIDEPIVTNMYPDDNTIGVSIFTNLILTFNEDVKVNTVGYVTIVNTGTSNNHEVISITSDQISVVGNSVTINPLTNLDGLTDYHVLIDASAIQDIAGNGYAGIDNTTAWNFTTSDASAPVITDLAPANNSIGIGIDSNLVITFNEAVVAGTGFIKIVNSSTSDTLEKIIITSGQVSINSNVVTIDPSIDFAGETDYHVLIDNGAITDIEGNEFGGISSETDWTFTTKDITLPVIITYLPADDAIGVEVTSNLQLTFSESVVAGIGNIIIMNANTATAYDTIDVTSDQVSVNSESVIISTTTNFDGATDYYVLIDAGAFTDLTGNNFEGITDQTVWNFTTVDNSAPIIMAFTPIDGATDVPVNSDLQITFNENVIKGSGNISVMNATTSLSHEIIDVTSDQVSISNEIATISLITDFDSESDYYILLDAGIFTDATLNEFAGLSSSSDWNFTTADITPPSVTISTTAGDTVTESFVVAVAFSEPVIGFTSDMVIINNGSVSSFDVETENMVWNVTIDPANQGDVTIDINADVVQDASGNYNTAAEQFVIYYDAGTGIDDLIPYQVSIYSVENEVIVEFTNEGYYQFEKGLIEVYNLLGQRIVSEKITNFRRFTTEVDNASHIYIVKVVIDNRPTTKRVYVE